MNSTAYRGLPTARTHLASVEYQVEELLSWVEAPGRGKPRNLARLYCIGALRQLWIKAGGNPAPGKTRRSLASEPITHCWSTSKRRGGGLGNSRYLVEFTRIV